MPGRPPLEGPFSATFKHGIIKASNGFLKTKIPICRSCLSEPATRDSHSQDESVQDASCEEEKHALKSDAATANETVITPGFSTITDTDQLSPSLTWQDPEDYVKWRPSSSDDTLKDGLIGGFTYFMNKTDLKWLRAYNISHRGNSPKLELGHQTATPEISEDMFELVMGLFEMITHFAEQFGLTQNSKQPNKYPKASYETLKLSEFEVILSTPINPTLFISREAPSWLPSPELLSAFACPIYKHWQQRKGVREGLRLIPVIERNCCEKPPLGYACFAPRPSEDKLWWSSSARSASLPPPPVRLLGQSLSQMWDNHLCSISKIREEVPAVNARYAFNKCHKFCKDDVSPMVADMQNPSAPLYEREEKRKSLTLEILTEDLKVMHDHENFLSVQRVNEYLEDSDERAKKANTARWKLQPMQKGATVKLKLKTTKATPKAQTKMGKSSSKTALNYRKPGHPSVSLPFSTSTLQNVQAAGSGRWVIRIGPSGQDCRPLALVYISNSQENFASPTPSTIYDVHSPAIADNVKPGPDASPVDNPSTEDILEVNDLQTATDALRKVAMTRPAYDRQPHNTHVTPVPNANLSIAMSKELQPTTAVVALPTKVSAGQTLEDEQLPIRTPSLPEEISSESQRSSVATAPVALASDSATPITFGSKVHQNASFSFSAPAHKDTPQVSSSNGSHSAPASFCSVHHTTATKIPPGARKADVKKRGKTGRPPRKRARTSENLVNNENLPSTL